MDESVVIEIKQKKNGIKVNTKSESFKIKDKKRKVRINSVKCKDELKQFLSFQSKALKHFFKLTFYSLALLGDSLVILLNSLSKNKKKGKVKKEVFV